jgi:hypothetical protein
MDTALDNINAVEASRSVYAALLELLDGLGPYEVQNKRTSLHITHGRAFLGVHPRATGVLVNIVTTTPLLGARVRKAEQVSANRYHNEVLVRSTEEVDVELGDWIRNAYSLTVA